MICSSCDTSVPLHVFRRLKILTLQNAGRKVWKMFGVDLDSFYV